MRMLVLAVLAPVFASPALAIGPEKFQADLDKEAAHLNKACGIQAKVSIDLASWDEASLLPAFSPTLQCSEAVKALALLCENSPTLNKKQGDTGALTNDPTSGYLLDVTPLLDLTEVRCTLDKKHEGKVREWLKAHPRRKRNREGDADYGAFVKTELFADLPKSTAPDKKAEWGQAVTTWTGTKMTVAYTAEIMNMGWDIGRAVSDEAKAQAAKPGAAARKKTLEERFLASASKKDAGAWKVLAEGNKAKTRESDARLAEAVKATAEKCDVTIPASIAWSTVQAPVTDDMELCRSVGSSCSASQDIELFTGACIGVLEGLQMSCADDKTQALIAKQIKSVSCRFDKSANEGKRGTSQDGEFPIALENGALTATWSWSSTNHYIRVDAWVKNNL